MAPSTSHTISTMPDKPSTVEANGFRYAALDGTPPHEQNIGTQEDFKGLPSGWEIAPNDKVVIEEVIGKHPWGTHVMLVAEGGGYGTTRYYAGPGTHYDANIVSIGETYAPSTANLRILIRQHNLAESEEARTQKQEEYCVQLAAAMWEQREFSDCEVCCAEEVVHCHRVVLAAASPVFASMLGSPMTEGEQKRITVSNAEPEIVKLLLKYAYIGVVETGPHSAALLTLADCYQMHSLMVTCAKDALEGVTAQNIGAVVCALRPLRERPEISTLWSQLLQKIGKDAKLLEASMMYVGQSSY